MESSNTDSPENQNTTLKRITGVVWFFLCLFGALAAIGILGLRVKLPYWEVYVQLGVVGGAATMTVMAFVQLGHAFVTESILRRLKRVSGFFLATFGAILVLGRLFEVVKYSQHKLYMQLGLVGTAGALLAIALLTLGEVFMMGSPSEEESGDALEPSSVGQG